MPFWHIRRVVVNGPGLGRGNVSPKVLVRVYTPWEFTGRLEHTVVEGERENWGF